MERINPLERKIKAFYRVLDYLVFYIRYFAAFRHLGIPSGNNVFPLPFPCFGFFRSFRFHTARKMRKGEGDKMQKGRTEDENKGNLHPRRTEGNGSERDNIGV